MKHIQHLRNWPAILLASCLLFFALFPNFDLWVTGHFYDAEHGFIYANHPLVQLSYRVFADLHWLIIASLIAFWLSVRYLFNNQKTHLQIISVYLLLALLLGPGVLVNTLFKSEWGRARPVQIVEFGGDKPYTAPFVPANNCTTNCSFVSGHAAMGFYFISLAWVLGRKRWMVIGMAMGSGVGIGRMLQGGHFFSDIVFAFWSVYLTCALLAWLLKLEPLSHRDTAPQHLDL